MIATVQKPDVLDETAKGKKKRGVTKPKQKANTPSQKLAMIVAGVASFILILSVWEVTVSLNGLTGMPWAIAALMAIGIDLGMVVCEAAVIHAPGTDAERWGKKYIATTVAFSMILNGLAAAQHAQGMWLALAIPIGAAMPVLVYMAFRVAGSLWVGK